MSEEEPLDTSMSATEGTPSAVGKLLRSTAVMVETLPQDIELNVELDVWEPGVREDE